MRIRRSNVTVPIVVTLDDNYALPFLGLARSLVAAAKADVKLQIFAMVAFDRQDTQPFIEQRLADLALEVIWIDVRGKVPETPVSGRFTSAVYFRCALDRFLPPELERVIYLDVDIVVKRCPSELFAWDLGQAAVGAVRNYSLTDRIGELAPETGGQGVQIGEFYFNSGVLLIDRGKWRACDVERRTLAYAAAERPQFPDQDALNVVLRGRCLELPARWNVQLEALKPDLKRAVATLKKRALLRALLAPAILHSTDWNKAWSSTYDGHRAVEFLQWLRDDELVMLGSVPAGTLRRSLLRRRRYQELRLVLRQLKSAFVDVCILIPTLTSTLWRVVAIGRRAVSPTPRS